VKRVQSKSLIGLERDASAELWFLGVSIRDWLLAVSAKVTLEQCATDGESPVPCCAVEPDALPHFRVAYFGHCAQIGGYATAKTKYGVSTDSEEVV